MRNVSNKIVENSKTHILGSVTFFSENHALYEIMFKNIVKPQRTKTIWRLRVAYWISKLTRAQAQVRVRTPTPTYTHVRTTAHTEIYNTCRFLPQRWLRERASMLLYTYITCHVTVIRRRIGVKP